MVGTGRIDRVLKLITMLQAGRRYSVSELAREMEVSRRTVFRDLNMLELAGIPYYFDPDNGGYRVEGHFYLPPVNLTITEALAVLTLAGRVRKDRSIPLMDQSRLAAMKLECALPQAIRQQVGGVIDRMQVSLGPVADHEGLDEIFHELTEAVSTRRICQMEYNSFAERKVLSLAVRPLKLVFLSRAWYLIAYAAHFRGIRTFKISRIKKLRVTETFFDVPRDIDVDRYFGNAWSMIPEGTLHDVHLHFDPLVAGNVAEVCWHRNQRVERNKDGSIEFYVRVDGLREITWWILGYGDQVEVVSPAALRRRVGKVATTVAARHGWEKV